MSKKVEEYCRVNGNQEEVVNVVVHGKGVSGRRRAITYGPGKRVREHFLLGIARSSE